MSYKFEMPELGEGLVEGEIANWHVKEGDQVKLDDILVDIENDKSVSELPSPAAGVIKKINFQVGDTATVGDVLVVIDDGTGDDGDDTPAPKPQAAAQQDAADAGAGDAAQDGADKPAQVGPATGEAGVNVLAMPSVRQHARELGVDLATVTPTGEHGHITKADVDAAAGGAGAAQVSAPGGQQEGLTQVASQQDVQAAAPAPAPVAAGELETRVRMSGVRKAIAKAMVNSVSTAPQVTNFADVEVSALLAHRKAYKQYAADQGAHLTFLAYIVKALVAVMKRYPEFNASIDDASAEIVYKHYFNVGIATATDDNNLFVPVVKDADRKSLIEIAKAITANSEKARAGKLAPEDMSGGSISISNVGSYGGGFFTPIVNHPEVAILGFGKISPEPIVNDEGELVVGNILKLSLSYDHRLIDGALAQQGLNLISDLLSEPAKLILEA